MSRRTHKSDSRTNKALAEFAEREELRQAEEICPPDVWKAQTPEWKIAFAKLVAKELTRSLSEAMAAYRNSAEAKALREKTHQHWLKAGIDLNQNLDAFGKLRLLVARGCPNKLQDTFDPESWFFNSPPREWFASIYECACQRTAEEQREAKKVKLNQNWNKQSKSRGSKIEADRLIQKVLESGSAELIREWVFANKDELAKLCGCSRGTAMKTVFWTKNRASQQAKWNREHGGKQPSRRAST
jgi:hypothetical protein